MVRALAFIGVLVFFPFAAAAQQPCTPEARRIVDELYRNILERPADRNAGGLTDRLANGSISVREAVREVAKSQEHVQRFLDGNHERSVEYLYKHLLGRAPDPGGMKAHTGGLAEKGPGAVIDFMLDSPEYQQKYGDDGVPGSSLRYCGPAAQSGRSDMRFREMDRNRDGVIARSEWRGTSGSFGIHDWNGDGVLSGDEVRPGARRPETPLADRDFDPADNRFGSWSERGFASIDRNRDNRITSDEWHFDVESFYRADRNRDGVLSRAEFTADEEADDRNDRFEYLDANGDGRIDREEWHGSADAFDWLDRNRNGVLSRAEVVGNERTAVDRFSSLDANRDGGISYDEWRWSRRSFDQQDVNRDGVITRREFSDSGVVGTSGR